MLKFIDAFSSSNGLTLAVSRLCDSTHVAPVCNDLRNVFRHATYTHTQTHVRVDMRTEMLMAGKVQISVA